MGDDESVGDDEVEEEGEEEGERWGGGYFKCTSTFLHREGIIKDKLRFDLEVEKKVSFVFNVQKLRTSQMIVCSFKIDEMLYFI